MGRNPDGFNPANIDNETEKFDEEVLKTEIKFRFSHSSGPGGQGVNTSDSKAQLRWNVDRSRVFSETEKLRIKTELAGMINREGELVLACQVARTQKQNKEMVLDKFLTDLEYVLRQIIPRIPTRPTGSSIRRRLDDKERRGKTKQQRRRPELE